MRVSIWRQFASNHSADFAIVGTFESAEWAAVVAEELRAALRAIGAWRAQFGDDEAALDDALHDLFERKIMTPPEESLKAQYQLTWQRTLDWVLSPAVADVAVQQYEHLVIVQPPGSTWNGASPFDAILERLGGAVALTCEDRESYLVMRLSAQAPDEASAQRILDEIEHREVGRQRLSPHGLFWTDALITRAGRRVTFDRLHLQQMAASRAGEPQFRRSRLGNQAQRDAWRAQWLGVAPQIVSLIEHLRSHGCSEITCSFAELPYS
jgi:hypothetical protein